ncbi:MAG: dephospho-CoA kinase [Gammaproteobacteria bacterium]|nr:dephospho-CoA kinase [Gammaproteobacteria bacterium]
MLRVGLTGGIAAGKSAVAGELIKRGNPVIDSDTIARDLVEPGAPGLNALVGRLGQDILQPDGHLDRSELRQRIFSDDALRAEVDALLHPLILREIEQQLQSHLNAPVVYIDIPLLVEKGFEKHVDKVLVVQAPEASRLARLVERDDVSEQQARAAMRSQATDEQRAAVADHVIVNDGSLQELAAAVKTVDETFHGIALANGTASE